MGRQFVDLVKEDMNGYKSALALAVVQELTDSFPCQAQGILLLSVSSFMWKKPYQFRCSRASWHIGIGSFGVSRRCKSLDSAALDMIGDVVRHLHGAIKNIAK